MKRMVIIISALVVILLSIPIFADEPLCKIEAIANEENYKNYMSDIEKVKDIFGEFGQQYIFTDENLNEKFNFGFETNVLGTSTGKKIYIDTNHYDENVVLHETIHAYDFSKDYISDDACFEEIYKNNKEKISVTGGNNQNVYEFFASSGENFFKNPDDLKTRAPEVYDFFRTEFN